MLCLHPHPTPPHQKTWHLREAVRTAPFLPELTSDVGYKSRSVNLCPLTWQTFLYPPSSGSPRVQGMDLPSPSGPEGMTGLIRIPQ